MPEDSSQPLAAQPESQIQKSPKQKKVKKWLLILLVLFALAGASFLVYKALKNNSFKQGSQNNIQNKKSGNFVYTKTAEVYSIKSDGTSKKRIVEFSLDLLVSPDFSKVGFIRDHNLWVVDSLGGNYIQLTTNGKDSNNEFWGVDPLTLGWSSDSKKILFSINPTPPVVGDGKMYGKEDPTIKYGFYLFDLEKAEGEFLFRDKLNSRFLGWPKGSGPLFIKGTEYERIYELSISEKAFKLFSNQKYPGLVFGHVSFSSDGNYVSWVGSVHEKMKGLSMKADTSQVFLANIDGTGRVAISPLGKFNDFLLPRFLKGDNIVSWLKPKIKYGELVTSGSEKELNLYDRQTKSSKIIEGGIDYFPYDSDSLFVLKDNSERLGHDLYLKDLNTDKEVFLDNDSYFDYSYFTSSNNAF